MAIGEDVRVVYRKYDGSLHWHHTLRRLGVDEHGVWLGGAAGTIARKGDGPKVVIGQPFVMLFPHGTWWTAVFNGPPEPIEVVCDVTTPVRWPNPNEVTMVDLDLDVCRMRAGGRVELLDEDEFAEHQVRYRYPTEVIAHAWRAATWLADALTDDTQPFAGGYHEWLALVR